MRTPAAFVSGMATMGVLATGIAWGAGIPNGDTENAAPAATDVDVDSGISNGSNTSSDSTTDAPSTPNSQATTTGAQDGTFVGDVIQTRYGPMQVEVVIAKGAIESARTLQQPDGDRTSQQINAQVIPILNGAIVQYQSLDFGNVSRATFSTEGYKESAQSALDKAGFTG